MQNLSRKHQSKNKKGGFIFPKGHLKMTSQNVEFASNLPTGKIPNKEMLDYKKTVDTIGRITGVLVDSNISRAKPEFNKIGPSQYKKLANGVFEMPEDEGKDFSNMDAFFEDSARGTARSNNFSSQAKGYTRPKKQAIDLNFEDTDLQDSDLNDQPKINRNSTFVKKRVFVDPERLIQLEIHGTSYRD